MNSNAVFASAARIAAQVEKFGCRSAAILGSGWGAAASDAVPQFSIEYSDISEMGSPSVDGHAGRITVGLLDGSHILLFVGRRHLYEGVPQDAVAFPVAVCAELGVRSLLITNASGGIRADLQPGCLMAVTDHINLIQPPLLAGPHDPRWGARFPDMSKVYDAELLRLLHTAADAENIPLADGIYMAVPGPVFETPAEVNAFRAMGADVVGMSTAPEATLAHAAGIRVAAVSCITNAAACASGAIDHKEVLQRAADARPAMRQLLSAFWRGLVAAETT